MAYKIPIYELQIYELQIYEIQIYGDIYSVLCVSLINGCLFSGLFAFPLLLLLMLIFACPSPAIGLAIAWSLKVPIRFMMAFITGDDTCISLGSFMTWS